MVCEMVVTGIGSRHFRQKISKPSSLIGGIIMANHTRFGDQA